MVRFSSLRTHGAWVGTIACIVLSEGTLLAQPPPAPEAPPSAAAPAPTALSPAPAPAPTAPAPTVLSPAPAPAPPATAAMSPPPPPSSEPAEAAAPAKEKPAEPFAYGDFTWLNGSNRQHKALLDSDIFTGSFLLDVNYTSSLNHPIDDTVVGSTALSRDNEVTLAFVGFGGDFHYKNARARLLTQFGIRSELVPRNDFSTFRGQFDLQDAFRYISEANGGVHLDVLNGINIDAGIFMSYVGLFSYDNFENWNYLASYTSDMTPWFFNGVRIQIFPSDRLKVEPWFINGWQTYGVFNEMPGFGDQILWRPNEWFSVLANQYVGWDTQDNPGELRFHSDNSATIKLYDNPSGGVITKMAESWTFDLGGQQGDGVTAFGGSGTEGHCTTKTPCTSQFLSAMAYHRTWFGDHLAFTFGGGWVHMPSRYLLLAPTGQASGVPQNLSVDGINYATATNPYDYNPGAKFDGYDYDFCVQYMPIEQVTYSVEWNHRGANVPYFAGHGGVTSPDGYITTAIPTGWRPDLVKNDDRIIFAALVRF
jgi:putative OmpL-like beta-barrel porin-2